MLCVCVFIFFFVRQREKVDWCGVGEGEFSLIGPACLCNQLKPGVEVLYCNGTVLYVKCIHYTINYVCNIGIIPTPPHVTITTV